MTDSETVPEFIITRHFDAPIERVFDAWADVEQYRQWSGPKGCTVNILSGEIREGSHLHSFVDHPSLPPMYAWCVYRTVRRPHLLVWEQSFADAEGNISKPPFFEHWPRTLLTTVEFAEEGEGTRITLTWKPIDSTPEGMAMFASQMASMQGGWGGSFDALAEFLAR